MECVPFVKIELSLRQEPQSLHECLLSVCKAVIPAWKNVQSNLVQVDKITGGISNALLKVSVSVPGVKPVAVKIFGEKTDLVIDRTQEQLLLLALNKAGFGAPVVGLFENGRVEEFLTVKTLTPQEMAAPSFASRIAKRLHEFHNVEVDLKGPRSSALFATLHKWLGMASKLSFADPAKQEQYAQVDFDKLRKELDHNEALCNLLGSPVVLSHNDLLSGNILILHEDGGTDEDGPMQFIDFEYSGWGLRGFDFGNHFNEYAGFECDYSRYPSPAQQRFFLKHYLEAGGHLATQEVLARLTAEADVFSLTSHLYWSIWSLIQASCSPIDFDYMGYSRLRWDEYLRRKPQVLATARELLGCVSCAAGAFNGSCRCCLTVPSIMHDCSAAAGHCSLDHCESGKDRQNGVDNEAGCTV